MHVHVHELGIDADVEHGDGMPPAFQATLVALLERVNEGAGTDRPAVHGQHDRVSTSATAAMLASASPRNPNDWMTARSASDVSLLVVCRTKAIVSSSAGIPAPSSLTRIDVLPAPRTSMLIRRAPASSAFSTSSLTTEGGRSITSPAAIASATSGGSSWINSRASPSAGRAFTAPPAGSTPEGRCPRAPCEADPPPSRSEGRAGPLAVQVVFGAPARRAHRALGR